jgi:hypothetical protein
MRGAALVEAAFMLPMFVILFYASLYAHNLGYNHIKMNRQARETAWAYAMANCGDKADEEVEVLPQVNAGGGSGEATKVSPMPDGPAAQNSGDGISGMVQGLEGTIADAVAGLFPNPNGAQGVGTQNLSWREPNLYNGNGVGFAGLGGSNTTTITESVTIFCNQAAKDGGAVNVLEDIGSSILSALGI